MLSVNSLKNKLSDVNKLTLLSYITLLQLWWIAVWGIAYIIVEYLSNKSKTRELFIYFIMLIIAVFLILKEPDLIEHL
jgi:predicted NACHT family NTPase